MPQHIYFILLLECSVFICNFHREQAWERWLNRKYQMAYLRKQPPRPISEISVREGLPSWKMPMCSRHRGLLENRRCSRTR